jgi:vacuolar-type H+-ATPase subunit I/STV1
MKRKLSLYPKQQLQDSELDQENEGGNRHSGRNQRKKSVVTSTDYEPDSDSERILLKKKKSKTNSQVPMIEDICLQLKHMVDNEFNQNDILHQQKKQKMFEANLQQLQKYKNLLNNYSENQLPFLKNFQENHFHQLTEHTLEMAQSIDQGLQSLQTHKNDSQDVLHFCQQQANSLKVQVCHCLCIKKLFD